MDQNLNSGPKRASEVILSVVISLIFCRLEIDTLHESWLAVLKDEVTKPYFLKVQPYTPPLMALVKGVS